MSDDGNTVAFMSRAGNLRGSPDVNGREDVYVRDIGAGTTTLASAPDASTTASGNGDSGSPSISGQLANNQYYVAFTSSASNLVPGMDGNGQRDVFRRAVNSGVTVLVSRTPGGAAAAGGSFGGGIADSGTRVAFVSSATNLDPADTNPGPSTYVRDFAAAKTELLSRTGVDGPALGGYAGSPAVSGDGKAFAWNVDGDAGVPGVDPEQGNLLARDFHRATPTTDVVARPAGSEPFLNAGAAAWLQRSARTVSADGSRVAFIASRAGLLRQAFVRDTRTGALILASRADGPAGAPSPRPVAAPSCGSGCRSRRR